MALTTPIMNPTAAFDASNAKSLTFNVIGGNQVVKNRLVVKNNTTNVSVYDNTITSFQFVHQIPANSLTNGAYYNAQVQTFDSSNNASAFSAPIQFRCYTTPVIEFTNIPVNNTINNSSFNFEASYSQLENELLNSYIFNLYDISNNIISTSGTQYINSTTLPPTNLSYQVNGFDDNTSYYIECVCQTVNNTVVSTGKIQFFVNYEQPNVWTLIELDNNMCGGYISISSNIISIDGISNPNPPIYLGNEEINLTQDGSWVKWIEGYEINKDFTLRLWGRSFKDFSNILTLSNNSDTPTGPNRIELNYNMEYDSENNELNYFEMRVYSGSKIPYYLYSNSFKVTQSDLIHIWIRRINNVYDLIVEPIGTSWNEISTKTWNEMTSYTWKQLYTEEIGG